MKNTMTGIAWVLLFVAAPALAAQGKMQADTGRAARMQRWEGHMRTELGLTDEQAAKLHATQERFSPQRRDVMQRARAIHEGLRSQLQPGVAANSDSVRKLLDAHQQIRAALAQLDRDQDRELAASLTPVQRARREMMYEHMMMRGRMHGPGRGMMRGQGMGQHGGSMRPGGQDDSQDDAAGEGDDTGEGMPDDQE